MYEFQDFLIAGRWTPPLRGRPLDVINPANERVVGRISLGDAEDADRAVRAARAAFASYGTSEPAERMELLRRFISIYQRRYEEIAQAITAELGAPIGLSRESQAALGVGHVEAALKVLETFSFRERRGNNIIAHEPVGVCAFITPWNWPMNQVACKVAPALAAGCTMVLKPSEIAPLSARLFAEVLHEAGVPPGVFNLVNGDGPGVGQALSGHPEVDMVSFTGSTRGGVAVAKTAADSVKRVHQELGGKSPNIILDADVLQQAVTDGVLDCFQNTGQSCNAPTRMLVPRDMHARAVEVARAAAETVVVGDPLDPATTMGPVISRLQFEKIQALIQVGVDEGATLVTGGPGRPPGLDRGYFVRPTVFADVDNSMRIAQEEIFGPVLAMIPYDGETEAVRIANDTPYGLAAYIQGSDPEAVQRVAGRLRAGMVHCNGASMTLDSPFGGYKQSGNGREWGPYGFEEFLETKAILGVAVG
ncbi:MAG: aldehyde dehydrogenase family protein [Chromatiales bacterium]|nr:MAG: aldehyde dehydrogenase family protein [Chromatiales bacterium]